MARLTDGAELLKCSFCGKSQKQVRKLIGGSGAYICDECIELCNEIIEEELGSQQPSSSTTPLPKPREINEFLNTWVIGQDRAKRALSVAVYNHYKRVRSREAGNAEDMLGTKSNILLLGPTGTGKTHLARCLARLLDVPFAIVDATALTEAGYVGEDVENILLRLIQEADGDIKKAEKGIIYVDEIDKIGRKAEKASITRDVSGEGVQQALLKIIEGTVASVPPTGGRKHPHQQFLEIDTSGILFIAAGAFAGIEDIVKARLGRRSTGFGSELKSASEMGDLYEAVSAEDLHKFGMIPEFIGRLPILTSTKELTEEALVRVLTEPSNSCASTSTSSSWTAWTWSSPTRHSWRSPRVPTSARRVPAACPRSWNRPCRTSCSTCPAATTSPAWSSPATWSRASAPPSCTRSVPRKVSAAPESSR